MREIKWVNMTKYKRESVCVVGEGLMSNGRINQQTLFIHTKHTYIDDGSSNMNLLFGTNQ